VVAHDERLLTGFRKHGVPDFAKWRSCSDAWANGAHTAFALVFNEFGINQEIKERFLLASWQHQLVQASLSTANWKKQ
jgi:hypothetical protein